MRLTVQNESNLRRFGCALDLGKNILYVRWTDLTEEQAHAATILVRTVYAKCQAGPLLCLALEISPTFALPQYFYFLLNPQNRQHGSYLSSVAESGLLHVVFLAGRKTISRKYQLSPSQRGRMKELFANACEALKTFTSYKFSDAVTDFENTVRIPQYFERAFSEEELAEALQSIKAIAENIPTEKRALARRLVHEMGTAVKDRFGDFIREKLGDPQNLRKGLLFLFDLKREFGTDYEGFMDLIADGVATSFDDDLLRQSKEWPAQLKTFIGLFDDTSPESDQKKLQFGLLAAFGNVLNEIGSGRGISFSKLRTLLVPLQPYLSGQPGRRPKDYSREYAWKASGLSWSEVARRHLQENSETSSEFGGREFASLTFEEKENLKGRVREGVRSYAERTGKIFPLPEPPTSLGEPPSTDNPLDTLHSRKPK